MRRPVSAKKIGSKTKVEIVPRRPAGDFRKTRLPASSVPRERLRTARGFRSFPWPAPTLPPGGGPRQVCGRRSAFEPGTQDPSMNAAWAAPRSGDRAARAGLASWTIPTTAARAHQAAASPKAAQATAVNPARVFWRSRSRRMRASTGSAVTLSAVPEIARKAERGSGWMRAGYIEMGPTPKPNRNGTATLARR